MAKRKDFQVIITDNNNVVMKKDGVYLLNQKQVGTNQKTMQTALSKLEKKQNAEIKKDGYISTY